MIQVKVQNGATELEITSNANNVEDLAREISEVFPTLKDQLDAGTAQLRVTAPEKEAETIEQANFADTPVIDGAAVELVKKAGSKGF